MTAYEGTHEEIDTNKGNHGSNHEDIQTLIKEGVAFIEPKVVEWRRYLHAHPELSGEEEYSVTP